MPSTVEKLGPARVKLTIEIPFAELKPHLDKAYREIAASVNIPGFRKGKVPAALIDQRFGRGSVLQEAINAALPTAYTAAIQETGLVPMGDPEIDVTRLEDGDVVEFVAEVDVRPEFEMPDFSTLSATVEPLADTDAEVTERLDVMRQRFATRADVERAAEVGDVVTVDLAGSSDGEPLEDATATGIAYKVGSGGMLEGLDQAVTGLSAGESAEFTSTLVGGPHQGQEALITVTVTTVQEETLPEVDDEFAQLVSEFDTVDEMRADLAEAVVRMARIEQLNGARDKLLEELIEKAGFELPEGLAARELEARTEQIHDQLARAGYTVERYLEESEEEAETPEEFWAEIGRRSQAALKAQIILDTIADARELGVEQNELTEMLFRRAAQNGTSPEQEMQHMMEHNHAGEWMQEIRRNKALQIIVDAASIVDTEGNPVAAIEDAPVDEDSEVEESQADEVEPADESVEASDDEPDDDATDDEGKPKKSGKKKKKSKDD